ncbi:MAG: LuxR C-terminal-related transcriptional regulator [Thermomicrobiales bacterium]
MSTKSNFADPLSGFPVYLTRFVGRESALDQLAQLLADPSLRAITLVGPGGVGKTRLAVESVRRAFATLDSEVRFIDGAMLADPALLLPEIADRLQIDRSDGKPVGEQISEALAGRSVLLVIDNMEHLLPGAIDIAALLRALPRLRVLATSRSSLHIAGELVIAVEPLATQPAGSGTGELSVAGKLFLDRAARGGQPVALDKRNAAIIETICTHLDGLPLAIELAAARLRMLSLPALRQALTRQLAILTGGPADVSERHQTLRGAIVWSYHLLAEDDRRLLRELGVFVDSFTLEAARVVCTPPDREIEEVLESIYDQALLARLDDDIDGQPRFRMLTSIRDFAIEQLRALGDEAVLRARHAAWFLELVESLVPNLHGEGQHSAVVRLDRMSPNVRQAFTFFLEERDQTGALRLAVALQRYWRIRALWDEGRDAFTAAMALGEAEPTRLWANALRGAAVCAELQFDHDSALDLNRRAIAAWESLGDRTGMALSLIDYGNVNNNLGRFDEAIAAFERAAELASEGERRTMGVARASMASAMLRKGALEDADRAHRDIASLLREIDDPSLLATFLSNNAVVRQRLGEVNEAQELLNECLEIQGRLGDEYGMSVTLVNLADLQLDPMTTVRYASEALQIASRISAFDVLAAANVNLGDAALAIGDVSTVAANYIEALDRYATIGDELGQADVIGLIGAWAVETNPDVATRLIGAAQAAYARNCVNPTSPQAKRAADLQDRLRTSLGREAFERERAVGQAWEMDDAVLEALAIARAERERTPASRVGQGDASYGNLTPRELDVLRLLADGKSNRQIASTLFITLKTADHHVARILAKLECRNRAAAVALAYQHGLVVAR